VYGFIGRSHAWLAGGARPLALAQERGQQTTELYELRRVSDDAGAAARALGEVQDRIGTADRWSTFDTFLCRRTVPNAIKLHHLAQQPCLRRTTTPDHRPDEHCLTRHELWRRACSR
jgi:hypothetical protein